MKKDKARQNNNKERLQKILDDRKKPKMGIVFLKDQPKKKKGKK